MFGERAFMQSSYSNIQHFIYHHYPLSLYKPIEFSSQFGVILEHNTALITLPYKEGIQLGSIM